jgi:membrane fusion protein (multidrug efflux system)
MTRTIRFARDWRPGARRLGIALCAGVIAACGQKAGAPQANGGGMPPPEVTVVTVQSRSVPLTTELAGRTAAHQIAEVRPQVDGIVKARLFKEGSDVKAGAPLYQIDAATYRAEVDRTQAALAKAEADLAANKLKAARYEELVSYDVVSKQARDDVAVALKQSEADVAAARAALEAARINLGYTTVTAPIGGRIGRSAVTAGALVTARQSAALATIQQIDPIYVDVTQSSTELIRLRREIASGAIRSDRTGAASVKLTLEDGSAYPLEGRLEFTEVSVDPTSGAVTLRAVFPNPQHQLLPGMYVRAILEEGSLQNAITVPQQGVTRDPRGDAIAMVVAADGTVQPRVLKVNRALGDQWLVTEGLASGDRVIVEGLQKARPGAHVKPVERSAPGAEAAKGATKGNPTH